jgi:branched-chain amino acid transport system ATP-binding protein
MTAPGGSAPLLSTHGLRAGFGAQTVLHGIDLDVAPGEVTGIFGLNGAGKSVLLKVIAGVVPTRAGSITLDGTEIQRLGPEKRVGLGMAHVPQGRQMFRSLTVEQNLRVGAHVLRRRDRAAYGQELERVFTMFPLLAERRRQLAGTLSGGQQAMLAVGRALISRPRIVLIDEPSAGLAPAVVEEMLESLLVIREVGTTMLLVEQNIRFGLRLTDTACLLQRGRIVYRGATGDLDSEQLASYLGVGRLLSADLAVGLGRPAPSATKPARRARSRA